MQHWLAAATPLPTIIILQNAILARVDARPSAAIAVVVFCICFPALQLVRVKDVEDKSNRMIKPSVK